MYRRLCRALLLCLLAATNPLSCASAAMATPGQFSVSDSGAATYTIPIQIPPGTAGIEPKLALSYNSQAGNSLLGVGWSLSGLSAITRCPRTMAQDNFRGGVNYDMNDRYCLDGQRLIAISGADGADGTEYRTELDSFAKVVSYGSAGNGPAWFKAWTKSGQVMEYGNTADSRIEAQGQPTVRVWALNRLQDTKGNYLTVTYTEDNANGDYYPQRIDYTGNANTNTPTSGSVQFQYESRPDVVPLYQAGSVMQIRMRLTHVQTYTGSNLIKDYGIAYSENVVAQHSLIFSITECSISKCLPPISLETQQSTQSLAAGFDWTTLPDAYFSGNGADMGTRLADLNGDGLPDLVQLFLPTNGWYGGQPQRRIFINTGSRSGTLSSVANMLGRKTSIVYRSLTDKTQYTRCYALPQRKYVG